MPTKMESFKNFILDGLLFLLPVGLMIFLLNFLLGIITEIVTKVSNFLPQYSTFGQEMPKLSALIILLLLVIFSGWLSRSALGLMLGNKIEAIVSKTIPGFSVVKQLFMDPKEMFEDKKIKSALALIDDAWLFAFILEEKNDADLIVVFVPSSPLPTSGNVYLMKEEQIKRLDISVKETVTCITQLGIGSGKILEGKIPK